MKPLRYRVCAPFPAPLRRILPGRIALLPVPDLRAPRAAPFFPVPRLSSPWSPPDLSTLPPPDAGRPDAARLGPVVRRDPQQGLVPPGDTDKNLPFPALRITVVLHHPFQDDPPAVTALADRDLLTTEGQIIGSQTKAA